MSNVIQIKRGNSKPDGKLAPYELGVQINDGNKLFIGGALNEDGAYGDAQQIKVENAENAENAINAINANKANNANYANKANNATNADRATNATNADKLGGKEASAYTQKSEIIGTEASEKVQNSVNADNAEKLSDKTLIEILKLVYPIGSIYTSRENTNPSTLFGFGTWEQISGKFILAANEKYPVDDTGGFETVTLEKKHLPKLSGSMQMRRWGTGAMISDAEGILKITDDGGTAYSAANSNSKQGYHKVTVSFGEDQPHDNMPPYLAVYMWQRTA